jgi:hypothetical protein
MSSSYEADLPILYQLGEPPRDLPLAVRMCLRLVPNDWQPGGWFFAMLGFAFASFALVRQHNEILT